MLNADRANASNFSIVCELVMHNRMQMAKITVRQWVDDVSVQQ